MFLNLNLTTMKKLILSLGLMAMFVLPLAVGAQNLLREDHVSIPSESEIAKNRVDSTYFAVIGNISTCMKSHESGGDTICFPEAVQPGFLALGKALHHYADVLRENEELLELDATESTAVEYAAQKFEQLNRCVMTCMYSNKVEVFDLADMALYEAADSLNDVMGWVQK